jgi:hypothetical protein
MDSYGIDFEECDRLYAQFPPSNDPKTWVADLWTAGSDFLLSKDYETVEEATGDLGTVITKEFRGVSEFHICIRWNPLPCCADAVQDPPI